MNQTPPHPSPKPIEIPDAVPCIRGISNESLARHIALCGLIREKTGLMVIGGVVRVVTFDGKMRVSPA